MLFFVDPLAVKGRYHCPPFTTAFQEGRIVNEDDNYLLDEFERCAVCLAPRVPDALLVSLGANTRAFRLDELRKTFLAKLDWDKCRTTAPFDKHGKELFERCATL